MPSQKNYICNALTVDVEDYFQVSAFESVVSRKDWEHYPSRIEVNVDRILSLFEKHNVKGTFFVLGWIAEKYPGITKDIVSSGHEIASHGYSHIQVNNQTPEQFRNDINKTRAILEDISGTRVKGYRAASYSLNKAKHWAHDVLEEEGYDYSSSVYPIKHDLYGVPDAERFPYKPGCGKLLEIPISTVEIFGHRFPCGGGGYFRLFPYYISKKMIQHVNNSDQKPCIFYFHPWELDIEQPVQSSLNIKTRIRHYLNLGKTESRLDKLLSEFKWGRVDSIYL